MNGLRGLKELYLEGSISKVEARKFDDYDERHKVKCDIRK